MMLRSRLLVARPYALLAVSGSRHRTSKNAGDLRSENVLPRTLTHRQNGRSATSRRFVKCSCVDHCCALVPDTTPTLYLAGTYRSQCSMLRTQRLRTPLRGVRSSRPDRRVDLDGRHRRPGRRCVKGVVGFACTCCGAGKRRGGRTWLFGAPCHVRGRARRYAPRERFRVPSL